MKFAIHIHNHGVWSDPGLIATIARDADEAGWDGVFVADHLQQEIRGVPSPVADPWIALAVIANATSLARLGPMVTPLPRRRPWQLASEAVTIDRLSSGRLILGLGSGIGNSFAPFSETQDPRVRAEMLEEGLDVLVGLWSGAPFTYLGKHFQVRDATFLPRPTQAPRIPIWLAGHWPHPKPFRRAARWDGIFIDGPGVDWTKGEIIAPDDLKASLSLTLEERARLGLGEPFDVIIGGWSPNAERMAENLAPFARLGATWWVEAIYEPFSDVATFRDRVRRGPPRL
ncbi:MAG: LLM class flavin-dependent oxidoreductase [Chloroflexi bacterium]|nr:LLM class flavin-dependent oxidoreductase [Chloroflexota bacterium]